MENVWKSCSLVASQTFDGSVEELFQADLTSFYKRFIRFKRSLASLPSPRIMFVTPSYLLAWESDWMGGMVSYNLSAKGTKAKSIDQNGLQLEVKAGRGLKSLSLFTTPSPAACISRLWWSRCGFLRLQARFRSGARLIEACLVRQHLQTLFVEETLAHD